MTNPNPQERTGVPMMDARLEIASRALPAIILASHDFPSDDATAVKWAFFYADALLAAHEATAPKAEALPEDDECWGCRRESAPIIIGDERFCVVCAASEIINLRAAKQRYIDAMPPRLPDDAPAMKWKVWVEEANGYCWAVASCTLAQVDGAELSAPMRRLKADAAADIPAVKAAATAYSAAKGCRAVFPEEEVGNE